jgi:hypothetical protein
MSMPPSPPGRFEAIYSSIPSRDSIGQPSRNCVFSSGLVPGTDSSIAAGPQGEYKGAAKAVVVTSRREIDIKSAKNQRWCTIFLAILMFPPIICGMGHQLAPSAVIRILGILGAGPS